MIPRWEYRGGGGRGLEKTLRHPRVPYQSHLVFEIPVSETWTPGRPVGVSVESLGRPFHDRGPGEGHSRVGIERGDSSASLELRGFPVLVTLALCLTCRTRTFPPYLVSTRFLVPSGEPHPTLPRRKVRATWDTIRSFGGTVCVILSRVSSVGVSEAYGLGVGTSEAYMLSVDTLRGVCMSSVGVSETCVLGVDVLRYVCVECRCLRGVCVKCGRPPRPAG